MKKITSILKSIGALSGALLVASCANNNQVTLPVTKTLECDVLVVGGGPAGLSAAIASARHGAKTILAERSGCLGGMATAGLVAPFMSSTTPDGNTLLIRGIFEEFVDRMIAQGGAIHPLDYKIGSLSAYRNKGHHGLTTFDYECFKRTADAMCKEAGVQLLYHVLFIKADTKSGKITGAYFATKAGMWKIIAKEYIDCTGDGDVAYQAGAPMIIGDGNGDLQATSLFFTVRGVDKAKMDKHDEMCRKNNDFEGQFYMREIAAAREKGEFPSWRNKTALFENLDGTWTVNMAQSDNVDCLDPVQVTEAQIEGRDQAEKIVQFLRKYVEGCENAEVAATAEQLGVRETRRIDGVYTATTEEIKDSYRYEDAIFCCANHMDIHRKGFVEYVARNTNEPYYIPYRSLLPKKVDNLLCAGRCASLERPVMAAVRVIPPCFAMGQAAGTAAAMAARKGIRPVDLDAKVLVDTLISDKVYFHDLHKAE